MQIAQLCLIEFILINSLFHTFYFNHLTNYYMGNLLYAIVVILIIAWLIGYLGFHSGGLIHLLLVIALIVFIVKLVQGKRVI